MAVYFRPTKKKPNPNEVIKEIKEENEKLKEINKMNMVGMMELANRIKELEAK